MQKVVVIAGPTSSGKTALSIKLARAMHGEIISADSRQVYRGLDIGTGKVTKREMRGVPHHLLDVADPKKVFSASDFVQAGRAAISDIAARGHTPIIVGGTGFYIDALIGSVQLPGVAPNRAFRLQLSDYSLKKLQKMLKKMDPERYTLIDIQNPVRLIRAIEIARFKPDSWKLKPKTLYDVLYIGLTLPPEELKKKIRIRLFARISRGMLAEARRLHKNGLSWKRMEELGLEYRYLARHLQGKLTRAEMLIALEKEINAYAKRQMTWFKRNIHIKWHIPSENRTLIARAQKFLRTK
jgi:tRNA dimethylallyltransferase